MTSISLAPLGEIPAALMEKLRAEVALEFKVGCNILLPEAEPTYAFNPTRGQYCSTDILAHFKDLTVAPNGRILAVTRADLYIPILTFVFGEAQLNGPCAVVSTHRLQQEVYGLPPNPQVFEERLVKEAVHELGHTFGLTHCANRSCVMTASHSVEWIDLKSSHFCVRCRRALGP